MEGPEQNVPEDELDTVIDRVFVRRRNISGVMPAMYFGRYEHVVEDAALDVGTPVRNRPADIGRGHGQENRERIEADHAKDEKDHDIPEGIIQRVGYVGIQRLKIADAVMIGVQAPQKLVAVLPAMHPVAEEAHRENDQENLQPERTELVGRGEEILPPQKMLRDIHQNGNNERGRNEAGHI